MTSIKRWLQCAFGTALLLSLTACGGDDSGSAGEAPGTAAKSASEPIVREAPPKVERGENGAIRYSGETPEGDHFQAQIGGDVALPDAFGTEIPAYPGSVATSAMETGNGTALAALDTKDAPSDVIDFYAEKLGGLGWSVTDPVTVGRGRLLTAEKGERRMVVNAESTDSGSRYSLMVGPAT